MNKTINILLFIFLGSACYAQNNDSLLESIKVNNPVIKAGHTWLESEKAKSKTGLYPDNPEVIFNYLWGTPENIGNQKELEITQKLKFPGYYMAKTSMQRKIFSEKQIMHEKTINEILFKAENEIAALAWLNKKRSILENRIKESSELVDMIRQGYERKEFSKPAYDKVRIFHLNNQTELERINSEILVHKEILEQLNGGIAINSSFQDYGKVATTLPSFESLTSLIESNPDVMLAKVNMDISSENLKVENMNRLPGIEAGYKGETILNQKLQGIHTGITIPLWENKGKVKQAKIAESWSALHHDQVVSEITAELKGAYTRAESAVRNYLNIKEISADESIQQSTFLLFRAGEISFPEYLTEVQLIYENQMYFLEAERDYILALNNLRFLIGGKL